ncbi:hypothetical protein CJ030_MR7G027953 [Morella rubra]|uniref:Uncharacterized protein n=1 Tax=Morella rubra TaxID=262757 RepID=A0A6A1UZP4_9ROSI|nr:hypothetical protein CJ030_MR7G027953 [Morella rubra]
MTKCPIMRGELILAMVRGCVVDLPLYIFLSLRSEAKITFLAALSYNLLLTQFLHSVGCMDSPDEERKAPIDPICRTTLSISKAQLRRLSMDLSEKNITNAGAQIERPTWAKELVVELNAIQMEVFAVRDHMSQMYLSLHTVLIQIRTLIKQVDNMEEQLEHVRDKNKIKLEHVRDAVRQDVDEPVRCRDSY